MGIVPILKPLPSSVVSMMIVSMATVKSKCLQIDFSRLSSSGSGDLFLEEGSIADLFSSSFTKCGSMHCNIIEELNNSSAAGILMTSSGYCSYHSVSGNGQALAKLRLQEERQRQQQRQQE